MSNKSYNKHLKQLAEQFNLSIESVKAIAKEAGDNLIDELRRYELY